ncbi:papain fold toxin domain-containing protein [Sorangium cellulosum]|uniref:Hint domain-containing protein n=1 Tax=Sorangium cellulosum So0157-2 TaxID=1254432 RepID=S4Y6K4_SORCE|nr:hypothetical protein SCE1572_45140 [Sorangium cellulosum So0157-2]
MTDARSNATEARYDTVGRMVELVSPDAGRTEWRYDLAGNLRAKQTAELGLRGQLIRYEYTYKRLSKIDYPVTQDVVYTYGAADEAGDAKGNRAGRLKQETSAAGTRSYGYDRFGNVAELVAEFPRLREPHRGPYQATLSYVFDSLGRMQEIHFPGSGEEIVRYGYDRGGLLVSAIGENQKVNPQHPDEPMTTEYLRHIGYDAFGQRVRIVAGNGVETKYRYNESTRRLSEVDADHRTPQMQQMGRPPRAFQRLRYDYDLVGNVLALDNAVPFDESLGGAVMVATTQQRFAYDDLNQLTAASGTYQERGHEQQRYTLDITYDVLGNVKKKGQEVARYVPNGPGQWRFEQPIRERTYRNEYRYTGPRPHAATQVDEFVPAESQPRLRELFHDANGNHKEWKYRGSPQRVLSWDEDNRLVSVRENGQELSRALYDGAGERRVHLHRVAGEEETAYVDQHLVVRNGVTATKHIFAGETRIASKIDADWSQEPPVLYYHPDHLGSTQYVTDQDQQLSQHVEHLPSGELWTDQTDSRFQNRQPYLFNGKELDLSTGLYHYGARSYEPRLGVWLSTDPILGQYMRGAPNGGVYDPIHLGMYTYTRNNPLRFVDPTGMSETCAGGGCESYAGALDSEAQSVDPTATECTSGGCVSASPTIAQLGDISRAQAARVHAEQVSREDVPIETSLTDPIDLVGAGGGLKALWKAGGKALTKLAARKTAAKAEALAARGAGGLCFAAGTSVHTEDGLRPIEEVRPGDVVWAQDEVTGEIALRRVVRTFVTTDQPVVDVVLEDDDDQAESIRATVEHPFWTQRGWVGARQLTSGDRVLQRSGTWSRVVTVSETGESVTVYNFEVERFHTYFVGEQGVLVHNNSDMDAAARAAIGTVSGSLFKPLQCVQCASAMANALKARGIPGQVLQIRAKAGEFIASDLVKSGTTSITRNGYHEAVRVGDTVFDNFFPGGVPYQTYVDSLHAIGGVAIKAVGF